MSGTRYLFVNHPDIETDLETFLMQTDDLPEYGQFFLHFTLTMWEDFMLDLAGLNTDLSKIEIHMFSERDQRPFFVSVENNTVSVTTYSPFHVAFFDVAEVSLGGIIEYEFDEEKYTHLYSQTRIMETHTFRSILNDIDEYGISLNI